MKRTSPYLSSHTEIGDANSERFETTPPAKRPKHDEDSPTIRNQEITELHSNFQSSSIDSSSNKLTNGSNDTDIVEVESSKSAIERKQRSLDGFEFLGALGRGTYGTVSKVRDKVTKEEYAMKSIGVSTHEGFPLQLLREIKTLVHSHHSNVVALHDVFQANFKVYLIMEYVENDILSIMESRNTGFSIAETKCLLRQLLAAVAHLHENWIVHRDIKLSNLLLSNQGILKLADFGLAREYGSPLDRMTDGVVTLAYRAPEVLLGGSYGPELDIWSCGCVFAELLTGNTLFKADNEYQQLIQIFKVLGTPNDKIWPGYSSLPHVKKFTFIDQPYSVLKKSFPQLTEHGHNLLKRMLLFDPKRRITAKEALDHPYFSETPLPLDPILMPTHRPKSDGKVDKEAYKTLLQKSSSKT